MREIKFRAWDSKERKWFAPVYEAYAGRLHDISITLGGLVMTRTREQCADLCDGQDGRYILQQFTGLHDKNGKEIYEGDVVRLAPNGTEPREAHEVKWNGTDVRYQIWRKFSFLELTLHIAERYVVIGNIYENPELMEV